MLKKLGFKFRLLPNKESKNLCYQFAGAARWVFNKGLEQRQKKYEEEQKALLTMSKIKN